MLYTLSHGKFKFKSLTSLSSGDKKGVHNSTHAGVCGRQSSLEDSTLAPREPTNYHNKRKMGEMREHILGKNPVCVCVCKYLS